MDHALVDLVHFFKPILQFLQERLAWRLARTGGNPHPAGKAIKGLRPGRQAVRLLAEFELDAMLHLAEETIRICQIGIIVVAEPSLVIQFAQREESPAGNSPAEVSTAGDPRAGDRPVVEHADGVSGRRFSTLSERIFTLPGAGRLIDRPTRRRAGVFRRALRQEFARLHDPRRLALVILLGIVGGLFLAGLLARGEAAGADARAYWAAGRLWVSGGDPYHPTGPFMPYVYTPWMLPIFVPWSLLPWDVAWFFWRGATIVALLWSAHWAYKRRPMTTAVLVILLSFPIAANLDTGNINLLLALLVFGAQFAGPRVAGLLWMVATTLKWLPAVFWPFLTPRGRLWGIIWFILAILLTALTLPATLVQLQVLFGFPRPARVDYFVFAWAIVPWAYRHPDAFRWLMPSEWPGIARAIVSTIAIWRLHWRRSPERTGDALRRVMRTRVRTFLGLGGA